MSAFHAAAVLGAYLLLAACASHPPVAPIVAPAPQRLAPDLCTQPTPRPARPPEAGLVRPATPDEQAAVASFLNWVAAIVDHDEQLAQRASRTAASPACSG